MSHFLRRIAVFVASVSAVLGATQALCPTAHADFVINPIFDSSFTDNTTGFGSNLAAAENAVNYAIQQFTSNFNNSITINITFSGSQGSSILGESNTNLIGTYDYATIRAALVNSAKSSTDHSAYAGLPVSDPSGTNHYAVATAEAKALGLLSTTSGSDGAITFGNGFNYTFDPAHRAQPGAIDLIGVAMHEISEVMGRIPGLGTYFGSGVYLPFDLFRFTAANTPNLTNGGGIYFSVDNGVTNLLNYNNGSVNGADPQDWASGQGNDAFNAFAAFNAQENLSATDLKVMDVLGYDAVPEPSTYLLFSLTGLVGFAGYWWSRRQRAAPVAV